MYMVVTVMMIVMLLVYYGILLMIGVLNDLWHYDLEHNAWIYLSGNQSIDIPTDFNIPVLGGLRGHAMIIDTDNLYILGGYGTYGSGNGIYKSFKSDNRSLQQYVDIQYW